MSNIGKGRTPDQSSQTTFLPPEAQITERRLADVPTLLRSALAACIKASPLSRFQIAASMSELMGRSLTKDMLDKYTADSAEYHRIPAELIPAICHVTRCSRPIVVMAEACGGRFAPTVEVMAADLAALRIERTKMDQQIRDLEQTIRQVER